ncbi:MAG: hypothetical protein IPN95_26455 [Bacteroidetes bacterium]|nr:hypothetical protein [Bacteroidota bacterium]
MKRSLLTLLVCFLAATRVLAWNTPAQSSPTDGATNIFVGVTIDWNAVSASQAYQLQVDQVGTFNSSAMQLVTKGYINSSSANSDTQHNFGNLRFGQTYHWRVRAYIAGDTSAWSATRTFTTLDGVTLATNDGTNYWVGITLDWNNHTGVSFYDLQADTSLSFNSPALKQSTDGYINSSSANTDTDEYLPNLFFGKTYYWRVRVRNAVDTSSWTGPRTFTTRDYVTMSSPTNGSSVWTGVTLDWTTHVGVGFYDMQADTTPNFNSPALRQSTDGYINSSSSNTDTDEFLTNLYFGKTYYWRVRARNAVDTCAWSTPWTFTTRNDVVMSSPVTGTNWWAGINLDWSTHLGVSFYDMQADTVNTFNSPALRQSTDGYINSSSSNTDTDEYLTNIYFGKTYYWRVRARNAVDTSAWATPWNFSTRDYVALSSPADNALNINTAGINVDWASHHGIGFYQVQIDTTNQFNSPSLITANKGYINTVSSNSDTQHGTGGLLTNRWYFWRVRAINNVDTTAWTTRAFSTGSTPIPNPAVPVHVSPADGASSQPLIVTLDWNNATDATYYEYRYSTSPSMTSPVTGTVVGSSVATAGLLNSTTYYWQVRSLNGSIVSAWSNPWSFTTVAPLGTPVPVGPTNGVVNQLYPSLLLDWSDVTGAVTYEFQWSTDPNFLTGVTTGTSGASNGNATGLLPNTIYYWQVRVWDGTTWSSWSVTWSFTTHPIPNVPTLTSPANAALNQLIASITLDWTDETWATGYEFQWSTDPSFTVGVTSGTSVTSTTNIGGLLPGTTYYWHIRSTDGIYFSAWSGNFSFTTLAIPAQPVHVSPANLSTGILPNSVTLDWNDATDAASYQWEYATNAGFTVGLVSGTSGSSNQNIGPLTAGTTYYWHIRSVNSSGNSVYSATWSFTTLAIPAVPVHVSPANGATGLAAASVTLDWNDMVGATGYDYQYSTDPAFLTGVTTATVGVSTANIGPLSTGTTYYWRVRATNGAGNSAYTTAWSFTTLGAPAVPVHVSPANGATGLAAASVTLDWNDITVATGYDWQYSTDPAFLTGVVNGSVVSSTVTIGPLANGTTYYWRVRATNGAGNSAYTTAWSFTTLGAPAVPVHVSPANGATGLAAASVTLDWNDITVATGYDWQYSTDPAFLTGVVSGSVVSSTVTIGPVEQYHLLLESSCHERCRQFGLYDSLELHNIGCACRAGTCESGEWCHRACGRFRDLGLERHHGRNRIRLAIFDGSGLFDGRGQRFCGQQHRKHWSLVEQYHLLLESSCNEWRWQLSLFHGLELHNIGCARRAGTCESGEWCHRACGRFCDLGLERHYGRNRIRLAIFDGSSLFDGRGQRFCGQQHRKHWSLVEQYHLLLESSCHERCRQLGVLGSLELHNARNSNRSGPHQPIRWCDQRGDRLGDLGLERCCGCDRI